MQTTVNLQDPFSYSIFPILLVIALLLVLTIYFIMRSKKNNKQEKEIPILKKVSEKDQESIKEKYLKELKQIESKLKKEEITTRIAYQNMSIVIRSFVYEMTNITVQNYTLREIKKIGMPILYELVKEYYVPEFSKYSRSNVASSIEKTRKVIEQWS